MDKKYIVKRTVCIEVDLPFKNGMLQLQEHCMYVCMYILKKLSHSQSIYNTYTLLVYTV